MTKITVKYIKQLQTLVIKNEYGRGLFLSTSNSLIITIANLATLLKFLIFNNYISIKVLENIVHEYYEYKEFL